MRVSMRIAVLSSLAVAPVAIATAARAVSYNFFECKAGDGDFRFAELDLTDREQHVIEIKETQPEIARLAEELGLGETDSIRVEFPRTNFTKCTFKRLSDAASDGRSSAVFDCFFRGSDGLIVNPGGEDVLTKEHLVEAIYHKTVVNNGPDRDWFEVVFKGKYFAGGEWRTFSAVFAPLSQCDASYSPF